MSRPVRPVDRDVVLAAERDLRAARPEIVAQEYADAPVELLNEVAPFVREFPVSGDMLAVARSGIHAAEDGRIAQYRAIHKRAKAKLLGEFPAMRGRSS